MTKDEFLRSEAAAVRSFMNRFANDDFLAEPGTFGYTRSYRCEHCGFRCHLPAEIFDHAMVGCVPAGQMILPGMSAA